MNLNADKLEAMLTLQDSMNIEVNPSWRSAQYPWTTAIMIEATEAIDHVGWKWWKKQNPDMDQVQMEIVDIWHFIMSAYMSNHTEGVSIWILGELALDVDGITIDDIDYTFAELDLISKLKLLVALSALDQYQGLRLFESILESANMTWDQLYVKYIAKNILNFFRQHNGYKEGSYIKDWFGQEDNEFLTDLVYTLDINNDDLALLIYDGLSLRYSAVKDYSLANVKT